MNRWWLDFYDDTFADLLLDGEADDTVLDVLGRQLGVTDGVRVLDQGCGSGRMARGLARRGAHVVGIDASSGYIDRARRAATAEGLRMDLHVGDARRFVCEPPCDAAISWHTSFGHFDADRQNATMLRAARRSLRPGAPFVLDYHNVAAVLAGFRARVEGEWPTAGGPVRLVRDSALDLCGGRLEQTWTWSLPDGSTRVRRGATRLYLPHELGRMMRAAGFAVVAHLGDRQGGALEPGSPRCVLVGRAR